MKRNLRLAAAGAAAALAVVPFAGAAAAAPSSSVEHVSLSIKSDAQHAKKGPDGAWHDAYLPARFSAERGEKVVVTVRNYDDAPHTFTSRKLGLNVLLKGGSGAHPSVTTFSFRPAKVGTFTWTCLANCDPGAMNHLGYMLGRITVTD